MGFHDAIVAAPSQKAALEAWGTRQDLFHEGLAERTQEKAAVEAALARPGVVLRRSAGSRGGFAEDAPAPTKLPGARKPARPPRRPDRAQLDRAEKALAEAEAERSRALEEIEEARRALDRRERELEAKTGPRIERLREAARTARRRFRQGAQ